MGSAPRGAGGRTLGALLCVCLAHVYDGIPVREAAPAASSGRRALGPWRRDALCMPLRMRGGERVKEGQVGKKGGKGRGDGKKRDKRRHQGASTDDGDGGEAAAEESQQAGEAGGGSGAAEGEEGVGEGRGAAGADVLSPKMFYGGNFTEDFPNRARVDALYREAEVFVQKREHSSSELEEESSGDGQGNNPFEVWAMMWCAGHVCDASCGPARGGDSACSCCFELFLFAGIMRVCVCARLYVPCVHALGRVHVRACACVCVHVCLPYTHTHTHKRAHTQYYTRKPMADNETEHALLALIKDCQSRALIKKAANEVCILICVQREHGGGDGAGEK